jgi:hypothetical protein
VPAASIISLTVEAAGTFKALVNFYQTKTAITQRTAIFKTDNFLRFIKWHTGMNQYFGSQLTTHLQCSTTNHALNDSRNVRLYHR